MAESNVKIADSTPEVEKKVESAPEAAVESAPAPTPAAEGPKVEEGKVEAPGRKSHISLTCPGALWVTS